MFLYLVIWKVTKDSGLEYNHTLSWEHCSKFVVLIAYDSFITSKLYNVVSSLPQGSEFNFTVCKIITPEFLFDNFFTVTKLQEAEARVSTEGNSNARKKTQCKFAGRGWAWREAQGASLGVGEGTWRL